MDTLFPIECVVCKTGNKYICDNCINIITIKNIQTCPKCNQQSKFGEYCLECQGKNNILGIMALSNYKNKITKKIIKKYKYYFIKNLAFILGDLLTNFFVQKIIANKKVFDEYPLSDVLLIPVPLHKKRLHWRGFNQSAEIAKKLAKNLYLNIDTKNLIKKTHTRSQAKLKGSKRIKNLKNCFYWKGDNISKQCIILIDDIYTTGATLNECATTLKKAGAKNIWGLVLASG